MCHVFFHQTSIVLYPEGVPCFVYVLSFKILIYFWNFYWVLLSIRDEQGRILILIFPLSSADNSKPLICFPLIPLRKFVEHKLCAELCASIQKKIEIHKRRGFREAHFLGQHRSVLTVMQGWLKSHVMDSNTETLSYLTLPVCES